MTIALDTVSASVYHNAPSGDVVTVTTVQSETYQRYAFCVSRSGIELYDSTKNERVWKIFAE